MEKCNIIVDSEKAYPILFIPKNFTNLEISCDVTDNVFIDMKITTSDVDGEVVPVYSGLCNVKLVDSHNVDPHNHPESSQNGKASLNSDNIDQMPTVSSKGNQTHHPDPFKTSYVMTHKSTSSFTVKQHNKYTTQNIFKYQEFEVTTYSDHQPSTNNEKQKMYGKVPETATNQYNFNGNPYNETESQSPENSMNYKLCKGAEKLRNTTYQHKDIALKQLISIDKESTSKKRNTILYKGQDPTSGETIQVISNDDPLIKCAKKANVDNKVIVEKTVPKKKYRCEKCKLIFDKQSAFRHHMASIHAKY